MEYSLGRVGDVHNFYAFRHIKEAFVGCFAQNFVNKRINWNNTITHRLQILSYMVAGFCWIL